MTRVLYTMPYSPWSERARFALHHHGLPFEEREHVPLLGELALRMRAGRLWGNVTVPLLLDGGVAVMDSIAIAEHVDRHGAGPTLFPAEHRAAIRALNERIEPMFQAGRARAVRTIAHDDEAALDLVPAALRGLPFATASSRMGSRFMAFKHPTSFEAIEERLRAGLAEIRALLGGRDYAHGAFSYADIIGATAVQVIAPVSEQFMPIGPVKRRTWLHPEIAAEYADIVAWRDALYAKHRPAASA